MNGKTVDANTYADVTKIGDLHESLVKGIMEGLANDLALDKSGEMARYGLQFEDHGAGGSFGYSEAEDTDGFNDLPNGCYYISLEPRGYGIPGHGFAGYFTDTAHTVFDQNAGMVTQPASEITRGNFMEWYLEPYCREKLEAVDEDHPGYLNWYATKVGLGERRLTRSKSLSDLPG